ncbi:MAG TPA: SDR family oxidoreductase [Actinomycetota bacterium]|nr:SDR family oxidoreductase [Actinomycetota bacterium]
MDLGLESVPAAVAAASRGLGLAIATELAMEGANVAICGRTKDSLEDAATSIRSKSGRSVHAVVGDVATADGAKLFMQEAAEVLGGLQVLVTNAGGPPPGPPASMNDEQWLDAIHLNFLSAVRMVREALPHIERNEWGRILAVTSTTVKQPAPQLALSNAARAATNAFMKSLADEIAGKGITVNCLMPGQIATQRLATLAGAPTGADASDPAFAAMAGQIPLGRVGEPEEFAAVAAFLCSKRASFVNGAAIQVDGGYVRSVW